MYVINSLLNNAFKYCYAVWVTCSGILTPEENSGVENDGREIVWGG